MREITEVKVYGRENINNLLKFAAELNIISGPRLFVGNILKQEVVWNGNVAEVRTTYVKIDNP